MAKVAIRSIFALMAIILMAVGLYQRVWVVQMDLNNERQNRHVYEKLYNEALDEVADWRKKYDMEVSNRDAQLQRLNQLNEKLRETDHTLHSLLEGKLKLQEENKKLQEEIARLKKEIQSKKI